MSPEQEREQQLARKCKVCGYPFGLHRMIGDSCPDVLDDGMFDNEVVGWKETTFNESPMKHFIEAAQYVLEGEHRSTSGPMYDDDITLTVFDPCLHMCRASEGYKGEFAHFTGFSNEHIATYILLVGHDHHSI